MAFYERLGGESARKMSVSKAVARDLENLLADRLKTACSDHFDSLLRMGAQPKEAGASVGSVVMGFTAELLANLSAPEHDHETGSVLIRAIRAVRECEQRQRESRKGQ